jgi:Kyakuja-Dileera-Zisupton transposase
MLITMDGNDSLKRVIRRDHAVTTVDGGGETLRGACVEREDSRVVRGDYYLSRAEGDQWSKANIKAMRAAAGQVEEEEQEEEETSPCEPRWKNMSDEATARSWGIFDETGIFLTLCRHGHVLVLMDMVQSGELYAVSLCSSLFINVVFAGLNIHLLLRRR